MAPISETLTLTLPLNFTPQLYRDSFLTYLVIDTTSNRLTSSLEQTDASVNTRELDNMATYKQLQREPASKVLFNNRITTIRGLRKVLKDSTFLAIDTEHVVITSEETTSSIKSVLRIFRLCEDHLERIEYRSPPASHVLKPFMRRTKDITSAVRVISGLVS
ncbi:hypothetical protein V8C42DRAFT_331478 [Trichoderma barbatum]